MRFDCNVSNFEQPEAKFLNSNHAFQLSAVITLATVAQQN